MASFNDVVSHIKRQLESDTDLSDICTTKWGRNITVLRSYKTRAEIGIAELPIILITRPQIMTKQENHIACERTHTIRLYCGFNHPDNDREQAHQDVIEFEEAIDRVLLSPDRTLGQLADHIDAGDSVNDEGMNHPVYFIVKEYQILREESYE